MSQKQIIDSYINNQPKTPDQITAQRAETRHRGNKYLMALGGVVLASLAGTLTYDRISQPDTRTIVEFVQPGDTIDGIVQRAEHDFGHRPDLYNYEEVEYNLSGKYPILQPGEKISVPVK